MFTEAVLKKQAKVGKIRKALWWQGRITATDVYPRLVKCCKLKILKIAWRKKSFPGWKSGKLRKLLTQIKNNNTIQYFLKGKCCLKILL